MNLNIKSIMAKLPVPFWLVFYIFLILIVIPTLAYLGNFGKAVPGDWQWQRSIGIVGDRIVWSSIASSADGVKLVAAADYGDNYIYTSTDSGITWTERT